MTQASRAARGSARGKVILLGEHAVVHGASALAVGMDRGIEARAILRDGPLAIAVPAWSLAARAGDPTLPGQALAALAAALRLAPAGASLTAEAALPAGAGLGSSAALAASAARALVDLFALDRDEEELFAAVQAAERVFHGNPSGLDAALALHGGVVAFSRAAGARSLVAPAPEIVVAHSGEPGATRETVARFAARLASEPGEGSERLGAMGELALLGIAALEAGDLAALGRAMNENHEHLRWFGVSTPALDRIAEAALEAGALGAKLTGGGGGGCAVALAPGRRSEVSRALTARGFQVIA